MREEREKKAIVQREAGGRDRFAWAEVGGDSFQTLLLVSFSLHVWWEKSWGPSREQRNRGSRKKSVWKGHKERNEEEELEEGLVAPREIIEWMLPYSVVSGFTK